MATTKTKDKRTCFVITPIGDNNSDIRRHIDGIIDQAIEPALGEKYEIVAAHRKYEIGSINDRVIKSVLESDLIIANLTNTNPNVMYELAIRHSFGKPAIVIAEEGTKLPFDVIDENTIFYVNDPTGASELKQKLIEYEKSIDLGKKEYGPVYKVINRIPLYEEIESGKDVSIEKLLKYVIDRLDSLSLGKNVASNQLANLGTHPKKAYKINFKKNEPFEESEINEIKVIVMESTYYANFENKENVFKVECNLELWQEEYLLDDIDKWIDSKKNISYDMISNEIY